MQEGRGADPPLYAPNRGDGGHLRRLDERGKMLQRQRVALVRRGQIVVLPLSASVRIICRPTRTCTVPPRGFKNASARSIKLRGVGR